MLCQRGAMDLATVPQTREVLALLNRASEDPNVKGLVVAGSWARGMSTVHSDVDVYVVLGQSRPDWFTTRTKQIDILVCTVADVRTVPEDPREWWDRYSFVDARVIFDRTDGTLMTLIEAQATLSAAEIDRCMDTYLDGYINFLYRSLKADREGRHFEQRLDGIESINWMLWVVFGLSGRVRPYNKYLRYELERRPLDMPGWAQLDLIDSLNRMMDTGEVTAQRQIYHLIESAARELGHGGTIESWGDELALIRGD